MGSPSLFDFFYLPFDSENDCNVGYCFVNFLDAQVSVVLADLTSCCACLTFGPSTTFAIPEGS